MSFLFGSEKSSTTIPGWVADPAKRNIANAESIAGMGYTPYFGPDVAAFNPTQTAAFQNTNDAMSAFGMAAPSNPMAGMPAPQTFAGGVQGYSSAPMYEQAVEALKTKNPAQYAALMQVLQKFQQPAVAATDPLSRARSLLYGNTKSGDSAGSTPHMGSSTRSLNTPLAYAPGGIYTRNPDSAFNRAAAALTSRTQSAPTSADRPMARR